MGPEDNSGWKGPQEIFSPTSFSKPSQLWGLTKLLRPLCVRVITSCWNCASSFLGHICGLGFCPSLPNMHVVKSWLVGLEVFYGLEQAGMDCWTCIVFLWNDWVTGGLGSWSVTPVSSRELTSAETVLIFAKLLQEDCLLLSAGQIISSFFHPHNISWGKRNEAQAARHSGSFCWEGSRSGLKTTQCPTVWQYSSPLAPSVRGRS